MEHHFNIEIANSHGVNVAIFLNNLSFWIYRNIANEKHFYDEKFWTYNSIKAFSEIFSYWSPKSLRIVIDYCLNNDLIIRGNYNENKYDRTTWYTFSEKGLELFPTVKKAWEAALQAICPKGQINLSERENGSAQKGEPIPDKLKPDINTDERVQSYPQGTVSKTEPVPVNQEQPLSLFYFENPQAYSFTPKQLELSRKLNMNAQDIFDKFVANRKSKGFKTFNENHVTEWFLRELPKTKPEKSNKQEIRSTVPHYEKPVNQETYTSKEQAIENLKAIRKATGLLSRKMSLQY